MKFSTKWPAHNYYQVNTEYLKNVTIYINRLPPEQNLCIYLTTRANYESIGISDIFIWKFASELVTSIPFFFFPRLCIDFTDNIDIYFIFFSTKYRMEMIFLIILRGFIHGHPLPRVIKNCHNLEISD